MPRASSSAKRQQGAANQRDTRHEGGLVGPGKRISKAARNQLQNQLHVQGQQPQSQAYPQGQVLAQQPQPHPHPHLSDGSPRPAVDDTDLANHKNAASSTTNSTNSRSSSIQPGAPATPALNGAARARDDDMAAENGDDERRASLGAVSVSSSAESLPGDNEENHRHIDINAVKNANVHRDSGPIDFALTVLRTCPLYDTIAILIILMQLSPVALSSIYMLFTLLTFVPPVHTSSGLSLTEIFEGTLGTPSLTTLVCMDVVVLLVWLFLWGPLQLLILDFAQIVIALTLGGGATSSRSSGNNIFLCLGMVLFSHFSRYPAVQKVSQIASLVGLEGYFSPDIDDPLEPAIRPFGKRGAYSWVRNVFAIHILTQGVVRYIREWYLRREKRDLLSQGLADPEAGKSTFAGETTDGGFATPDLDGAQTSVSGVSGKRKKRQSAQVRIRQPLWAALASTKIVMVKEYELSHAASESLGAEATDVDNLGNAPFYTQPGQIWICYVGFDEVCFNTSGFPHHDPGHENGHTGYVDTSKPFFVRVNNATWQPTRINVADDDQEDEGEDGHPGTRWTGDIYGLTPSSNYEVEFVCTITGDVLFSTSVRTTQAPHRDREAPAPKPDAIATPRRRHESPATTIKASIATQEAKLADEKSKLKTLRKDNNRKVNALKKEIDKLAAAVQSSGGNDEKLRQKITQNTVQQKQAEQSLSELDDELKELQSLPDGLVAQHRAKQSQWNAEKAQFDGARASFKSFKHGIDRQVKALEEEQASLQAKRTKIATRIAKADNDHARITDANARGLDEAERRRQERSAYEAEAGRLEQGYLQRIADLRGANEQKVQAVNSLTEMMRQYLASFDAEVPLDDRSGFPPGYPPTSGPSLSSIPWAPAPAPSLQQYPQAMWPPTSGAPGTMLPAGSTPPNMLPAIGEPPGRIKPRHRSSSMLSDVSGFTQSSDGDDLGALPLHAHTNSFGNNTSASNMFNNPAVQYAQHGFHAHHFMPPLQTNQAIPIRSPPGFTFARARGSSGSGGSSVGLGSGSSVRSGSGSGSGSVRDPTSPV